VHRVFHELAASTDQIWVHLYIPSGPPVLVRVEQLVICDVDVGTAVAVEVGIKICRLDVGERKFVCLRVWSTIGGEVSSNRYANRDLAVEHSNEGIVRWLFSRFNLKSQGHLLIHASAVTGHGGRTIFGDKNG
jgi:hypothetical protein